MARFSRASSRPGELQTCRHQAGFAKMSSNPKVLKAASPIPIQRPMNFEFVTNLKTDKALSSRFRLLLQAD